MDNFSKMFANNLMHQLESHKISQAELARHLNISTAAVNTWCKGIKLPKMGRVDQICAFLDINRSDLMEEPNKEHDLIMRIPTEMAKAFLALNEIGRSEAIKRVQELAYNPAYTSVPAAPSEKEQSIKVG